MSLPRLYTEFAHYWRLMSPPEEYAREARFWRDAIQDRLGPGRHRVLELGVGGGHNMSHLTGAFEFTAVDLAPVMIEQARLLNPHVEFHHGDMRTIRLGRAFDVVLIHDAISYLHTEDDLRAVLATACAHVREGGLFITSPDYLRETFRVPAIECRSRTEGRTEFTCFEYTYDPDPSDTAVETLMWYLIRQDGGPPRIEQDRHTCGLFSLADWERLIGEADMRFEKAPYPVHEDGRESWLLLGLREGSAIPHGSRAVHR